MTDRPLPSAEAGRGASRVRAGLRRRHAGEMAFRILGIGAVVLALGIVGVLFVTILSKGIPAFQQATIHLDVTYDPEVIDVGPPPAQAAGQSDADHWAALLRWERDLAVLNWNTIVEAAVRRVAPEVLPVVLEPGEEVVVEPAPSSV